MDEPKVSLFIMGSNTWRRENEYPLAREVRTDYYFRAEASGSVDSLNDGTLSTEAPGDEGSTTYEYDPRDSGAVDRRRPCSSSPWARATTGPADVRSLTFTTPVLEEDTEVTGNCPPWSSGPHPAPSTPTGTVTIADVHPDGYSQTPPPEHPARALPRGRRSARS